MEHAEALERIEIAAVEPDGIERLMAGDTPDAAAVAGHLAGCEACTEQLARIRRASTIAREAIRSLPDPALRDRTLAFVRQVGRDRSAAPLRMAADRRRWTAVFSGLAAAVVIAGLLGFGAANVVLAPVTDRYESEIAVLSEVADTMLRIEGQPDAVHVALAAVDGRTAPSGSLLYSPSDGRLVMVAAGLAPPPTGQEYGCWLEADGQRRRIGRMYPAGDVQAWVGPVDGLADLRPGARFGVSLVPVGGGAGDPVLSGGL